MSTGLNTGLTEEMLVTLRHLFEKYPAIEQVKLYGSRAKGNYHSRSDIDLVAFGEQIDRHLMAAVLLDLDDSDIPYQIDLQNYHEIKNPQLLDHINRIDLLVYERHALGSAYADQQLNESESAVTLQTISDTKGKYEH